MHRRGLGVELKNSYYNQAVINCEKASLDAILVDDYNVIYDEKES